MDQGGKKILCCEALEAAVEAYGKLAEGLNDKELGHLNEAADEALAIFEPALKEAASHYKGS